MKKILLAIVVTSSLYACHYNDILHNNETSEQYQQATLMAVDHSAHWLDSNSIVLVNKSGKATDFFLLSDLAGFEKLALEPIENSQSINEAFPHLTEQGQAYKFVKSLKANDIKSLLKTRVIVAGFDASKKMVSAVDTQIGNAIDALYTQGINDANEINDFGALVRDQQTTFTLWAPTAKNVSVLLFNDDKTAYSTPKITLEQDTDSGAWSTTFDHDLSKVYFQYELSVYHPATKSIETIITTDPYSLSLSTNSEYSQVVNLSATNTMPDGWVSQKRPTVDHYEDNIFYELHIGDFSANDHSISREGVKGKYKAFAEQDSDGINHLKTLHAAGLNNIHLMPTFDLGTINEATDQRIALTDTIDKLCSVIPTHSLCSKSLIGDTKIIDILKGFDSSSNDAEHVIEQLRTADDYNWGYDPFHYTVPEGSYAQNPEGTARIIEFREMVQNIHNLGFRVIMDVVYNHTHEAGLNKTSVLDKIVPNYYQRLNPVTGKIEQSTCCDNTATERVMMAKLMTDSLVTWARDYAIDGFRFDLMAHQPKAVMLAAREAVLAVDPDNYFYGEGWNFGEVQNNQRFVQASQLELAGTEIGTFTDRLRDAVRGAGMSAKGFGIRKGQGIGNGLYTIPNDLRSQEDSVAQYLLTADQLRVGLAGNLITFPIENAEGKQVTGADIPYGNQPAGYALDPADTINYVSKHDNQTLWDNNQYRNDYDLSTEDRVRLQTLSLSYPLLAQGIPFLHMGSEFLRSKSFLRDSYDFSHWFNKVDFSGQTNNYNVGLPPANTDKANWQLVQKVLVKNDERDLVQPEHIEFSKQRFIDLIKIRMGSPLFRLTNANAINQQVSFLNTGPEQQKGLIVMSIKDSATQPMDENYQQIIVLFNSSAETKTFAYDQAQQFELHPVQAESQDAIVKKSHAKDKSFIVSKLSAAVFVLSKQEAK